MSDANGRKHLSHLEFARLVEGVKTYRDGISKCTSWQEATRFLIERLHVEGVDLPLSPHSVEEACGFVGVATSRKPQSAKRDSQEFRETLAIMTRAIAKLYEKLSEPMTPAMAALVGQARREKTIDEVREELNIAQEELDRQARDRPGHPALPRK